MNKTRRGFTLIELLVVIAIIGILSSIAIVYLSDARKKANDAKVSSNVTTASTQVELDRANGQAIDGTAIGAVTPPSGVLGKLGASLRDAGRTGWTSDGHLISPPWRAAGAHYCSR
jgi:prepilin-type N-terminal cleavage/methylation domain-containing protein